MMLLKNKNDIDNLIHAVEKCDRDVVVRSADGTKEYSLKSIPSRYVAIGELCKEHGDEYEVFCLSYDDEVNLLQFFYDLHKEEYMNRKCA